MSRSEVCEGVNLSFTAVSSYTSRDLVECECQNSVIRALQIIVHGWNTNTGCEVSDNCEGLRQRPRYATFTVITFFGMRIFTSGFVTFYLIESCSRPASVFAYCCDTDARAQLQCSSSQVLGLLLELGSCILRVLLLPGTAECRENVSASGCGLAPPQETPSWDSS